MASIYIPPVPGGVPLNNIVEPTNLDVLNGRDGYVQRHVGNQSYRQLVNVNKEAYITCKKTDKLKISRCVVAAVRERGGRFLEKDKDSGMWYDIGDKKAVEKTSQALREGQPKLKKKMVETLSGGVGDAGGSSEKKTIEFKRTPEFEREAIAASNNAARIAIGTPTLETIATNPLVDPRPTGDPNHDPYRNYSTPLYDVRGPSLSHRETATHGFMYPSQLTDGTSMNSIAEEETPYTNYEIANQSQEYLQQRQEFDNQVYGVQSAPAATSPSEITPAWHPDPLHQDMPAVDLHRQTTEPHANFRRQQEYQVQPPSYGYTNMEQQPQQYDDYSRRPPQPHQTYNQPQPQQQMPDASGRDRFPPPVRTKSSDSMMSSGSSIGPGRIPSDWVTQTTGSAGSGITSSNRQVDRRRMFAKMKGSYPSSVGSRRSTDGMPDIHMVESNLSLLSVGSNINSSKIGMPSTTGVFPPVSEQLAASRDDLYILPLTSSARLQSFASSRRSRMSKDDTYTLGSRRSLMSGISNFSGDAAGTADTIFADMGRKFGTEVSTRSMAMSEISGIEEAFQQDLEGLTDFELKCGDDASAI